MKKLFYLPIVAIVVSVLLCTACKKKETPQEKQEFIINTEPLVVHTDTLTLIDITDSIPCGLLSMDSITLINDNDKLKELCPNASTLDFNRHSLIIVSGGSTRGIISVNGSFTTTDKVHYNLIIDVRQNMTCVAEGWNRYYLITKINTKENILLTINCKPY